MMKYYRAKQYQCVAVKAFKLLTFFVCFSGYFNELLNRSSVSLQETFTSTFGLLYYQSSQVFSDLYADLRHYYRSSNVNLEEVLNDFWAKLLEKLFSQANKQYSIGTFTQYKITASV